MFYTCCDNQFLNLCVFWKVRIYVLHKLDIFHKTWFFGSIFQNCENLNTSMYQFMHHLCQCIMHHIDFKDWIYIYIYIYPLYLSNVVCPWICVSVLIPVSLDPSKWPPKKAKTNVKTKAKIVVGSTSTSDEEFDQIRFHTLPNGQKFETLVMYRSIWSERQINLDKLDLFVKQNLESRSWLPFCTSLVSHSTSRSYFPQTL